MEPVVRWAHALDPEVVWALEDCRHVSHHLERALVTSGDRTAAARAAQERALTEQAEHAYSQLVADWKASAPSKKSAGAAPGRAPNAARQGAAPNPVL